MADYLLDTNILSYWYDDKIDVNGRMKPTHESVVRNVARVRTPDPQTGYVARLFVSTVMLGEVEYGHRCVSASDPINRRKQSEYATFIREQCPVELDITRHVAEQYGQMRAWLFDTCSPRTLRTKAKRAEQLVFPATGQELGIDENDLWIAAQAMTHGLVLVTHDRRGNFGKVLAQFSSTLRVEPWADIDWQCRP